MAHAARLSLRMQKELKLLVKDPPPGVSLLPFSSTGSSSSFPLTNIEAWIEGPEGTVYSKGIFAIKIQIPERYPFQPPNVTFMTPIYHPNIDNGGRICLDILNLPPKGAWQPSLNISTVLTSIGLLMSEPNPDDGLMCETSREYKYNRQAFDQKARSWTEEYAKAGPAGNNNNVGVLAISSTSTVVESERVEDRSEVPLLYENQRSLMKSHVIGEKLSLKHMAPAERSYTDNKENMAPTRRHLSLSLSRSQSSQKCQNPTAGSSNSVSVSCVLTCDKQDSQMESSEKPLNGNKEQLGQGSKLKEVAIVSDSEESDEEGGRPIARRRLCLSRKQIVKK